MFFGEGWCAATLFLIHPRYVLEQSPPTRVNVASGVWAFYIASCEHMILLLQVSVVVVVCNVLIFTSALRKHS